MESPTESQKTLAPEDDTLSLEISEGFGHELNKFSLVAKVILDKRINHKVIKATLSAAWKQEGFISFSVLDSNNLLCSFENGVHCSRIHKACPWNVKGSTSGKGILNGTSKKGP